MAFSLSGTTITQTGTDTSLAGLSGIAGVTTSTFFGVVTVFNIGNYRLVINGTLSFNAELQALQIGTGAAFPNIEVAGVFDIGLLRSKAYAASQNPAGGSFTRVQRRPAVVCNRISPSTFLTTEASLQVNSGGVCRMYGTTLLHGGTIHCVAGSTFEAFDGMLYCIAARHRWFYSAVGGTRLYIGGDDATNGGVLNLVGTSVQYLGIEPDQVDVVYSQNSTLRNFVSNRGVTIDHRIDSASVTLSLNPLNGSDCRFNVNENPANNTVQNTGGLLVKREVNVQVTDSGGAPIQNCKVVVPYTNDGNRRDGLGQTITTLISESGVTNLSGAVSLNVLLAAWIRTTAGVAGIANQGLNAPTYLNKNGNGTADLFDIRFFSYGYVLSENTNVSLRGQNALQINQIILSDASITESTKATVDAYTAIDTSAKLYDRAKSWLFDNYAGQTATLVTRSGNLINAGSYNITIDATAAQVFALAGSTLTIKASTYTGDMTTTGLITLTNGATFIGTRTDANGTVAPPKVVSITGITAGSRLRVYNNTTATEVVNQIVAGTSYTATYNEGTGYTTGDTLTVTATWQSGVTAKLPFLTQVVVGATGWSALVSQQADTVYDTIAVDGSTVTEFAPDYPNVQVDISDPNGQTSVDRLYSWFVHTTTTESGIRNWFGGIVAEDAGNFRVVTSILNLKLDNLSSSGVEFVGGIRLYRDDNATPLVASTTGGGSITLYADKVYVTVVSTASPVITGDIAQVPAAVQSGMTAQGYTTTRATNLDNLDVAVSTRLASSGYTTPPTVAAIRTEIDTNSTKLDAAVSTRLAAASYTAPANADITAIKAKTDNLPSDPADESSIQAAIAAIPPAPSSTTVATAVRSELATELARIDVATSTRLASASYTTPPTAAAIRTEIDANSTKLDVSVGTRLAAASYTAPPTPAANATAVRTELTTELARIDVATSTRLATASYIAPANADIAAIKVKTDNLPVDPASTTNITNTEATLKKKIIQAALI